MRKYNANGELQWTRLFGTEKHDQATAVALNNSGGVYIVGSTWSVSTEGDSSTESTNAFVRKYNANGEFQWTQQFGDYGEGVALNRSGDIYVVGTTYGALPGSDGSTESEHVVVSKYNPQGDHQWTQQFGTEEEDNAFGITVDSRRHGLYIVGCTEGALSGGVSSNKGGNDAFVHHLCDDMRPKPKVLSCNAPF